MGIEPSSQSHYLIEITHDKNGDRPKPSSLRASMRENRCQCSVLLVPTSVWHEPMSESWAAFESKASRLLSAENPSARAFKLPFIFGCGRLQSRMTDAQMGLSQKSEHGPPRE
jgi:hypothetical protein